MFIYTFISSVFFLSNSKTLNFLSHFSVRASKLKLDTQMGKGLICYVHQIQAARIYLFLYFSFFLSLQLAKIKNLHLQNCFNLPLMAEFCSLFAIFSSRNALGCLTKSGKISSSSCLVKYFEISYTTD